MKEKSYWFNIWFNDKTSILNTMIKNMNSDINCGYDYFSRSIVNQREMIDNYKKKFDNELHKLKEMQPYRVEHWCYLDLKQRGAID